MTSSVIEISPRTPSQLVASEIRAELARQGRSQRWLAAALHRNQAWISRRISPTADIDMTLEEISDMAEALNVSVQGLVAVWLPRLDSNQQPSDSPQPQVRGPLEVVSARVYDLAAYRLARAS